MTVVGSEFNQIYGSLPYLESLKLIYHITIMILEMITLYLHPRTALRSFPLHDLTLDLPLLPENFMEGVDFPLLSVNAYTHVHVAFKTCTVMYTVDSGRDAICKAFFWV